jgi:hypothetical protein
MKMRLFCLSDHLKISTVREKIYSDAQEYLEHPRTEK